MKADKDDMRKEYDFSKGERGRYAERFSGSNVIILDPDVAAAFN